VEKWEIIEKRLLFLDLAREEIKVFFFGLG